MSLGPFPKGVGKGQNRAGGGWIRGQAAQRHVVGYTGQGRVATAGIIFGAQVYQAFNVEPRPSCPYAIGTK